MQNVVPFSQKERPPKVELIADLETQAEATTTTIHGFADTGDHQVQWGLELPNNPVYSGLVTEVPGFGGIMSTSVKFRHEAALAGFATLAYEPARHNDGDWWATANDPHAVHTDTLTAIDESLESNLLVRRAEDELGLDLHRKILAPHSMGGIPSVHYANRGENQVDAIVNMAAAGYGHPTIGELARHAPINIPNAVLRELLPGFRDGSIELGMENLKSIIKYYMHVRSLLEGLSCLHNDIRPQAERARTSGTYIGYIAFGRDILIPPTTDVVEHVDHYEVMTKYGHIAPMVRAKKVVERFQEITEKALAA